MTCFCFYLCLSVSQSHNAGFAFISFKLLALDVVSCSRKLHTSGLKRHTRDWHIFLISYKNLTYSHLSGSTLSTVNIHIYAAFCLRKSSDYFSDLGFFGKHENKKKIKNQILSHLFGFKSDTYPVSGYLTCPNKQPP